MGGCPPPLRWPAHGEDARGGAWREEVCVLKSLKMSPLVQTKDSRTIVKFMETEQGSQ